MPRLPREILQLLDGAGMGNAQATCSLEELLADLRAGAEGLEPGELDAVIEEGREQFYQMLNDSETPAGARR